MKYPEIAFSARYLAWQRPLQQSNQTEQSRANVDPSKRASFWLDFIAVWYSQPIYRAWAPRAADTALNVAARTPKGGLEASSNLNPQRQNSLIVCMQR